MFITVASTKMIFIAIAHVHFIAIAHAIANAT